MPGDRGKKGARGTNNYGKVTGKQCAKYPFLPPKIASSSHHHLRGPSLFLQEKIRCALSALSNATCMAYHPLWGNRRGFVLLADFLELLVEYKLPTWATVNLSFPRAQGQYSSLNHPHFWCLPAVAKNRLKYNDHRANKTDQPTA